MSDDHRDNADTQLLYGGLAFFGAVTASVSHELNNVISIIDQTTGLVEDIVAAAERGAPISAEKLEQIVGSLQRHTSRGLEIIKRLNKFAHSSDVPRREYDINEAAGNVVELSRRLAGLKRVNLDVHVSSAPVMVNGNPFLVQQLIFASIQRALQDAGRDETISVRVESAKSGAEVNVDAPQFELSRDEFVSPLMALLLRLAPGTLELSAEQNRTIFRYHFSGGG
jgi:C4-dicarboxylate-specific signal transduction histidine kinase